MTNVVKLKRGSGSDPSASDMVVGEPVIRTDTAELFFKKDDGTVAKVSGGGGGPDFKYLALRNAANNGAASYPAADFTLVTDGTTTAVTPAAAATLLVSYAGVIQQPSTGTSTPANGFALSGSTIKFSANIAAAPDFIVYQESGGIGEPSDNTVSEAKLKVSNSPTNGYFLSAQSGNTGGLTWAEVNLSSLNASNLTSGTVAAARLDTATTQSAGNNSTKIATTAYTDTAISNLVDSSPGALNTLNELAAALGDDANFSTTVTNSIATKLPLAGGTLTGNVLHNDNVKALFGTGSDLEIYHDGSHSHIREVGTGDLRARSNKILLMNPQSEEYFVGNSEGSVELYYDDVKRFETTASGVNLNHTLNINGPTGGNGNANLNLKPTGSAVYTNLYFYNAAGNSKSEITGYGGGSILFFTSSSFVFSSGGAERWMSNDSYLSPRGTDGSFDLGGSSRRWGDVYIKDSKKIKFGDGNDLEIYHDGSNSFISDTGTGGLKVLGSDIYIRNPSDQDMIHATSGGAVSLYYDNIKTFETISEGVRVQGDEGTSAVLELWADQGDDNGDKWRLVSDQSSNYFALQTFGPGSFEWAIRALSNSPVDLYYDNSIKLSTKSDGILVTGEVYADGVRVYDNESIRFGTNADLAIVHEPNINVIRNNNAVPLYIRSGSETNAEFHPNAAVKLYYDNSLKLQTTANGIDVTGKIENSDNIDIDADNKALRVGDAQNFQFGYNSSTTEGEIKNINASGSTRIKVKDGDETAAVFTANGGVELYYDNSKKFDTTSGGVEFHGNTYMNDAGKSYWGTGNDLQIWYNGSSGRIGNTGTLWITGSQIELINEAVSENMLIATQNAAVKLYYDNSLKFETKSYGAYLTGTLHVINDIRAQTDNGELSVGASDDLKIYHDGSNSYIKNITAGLFIQGGTQNNSIYIRPRDGENSIQANSNSSVDLYYDNSKKFETTSSGITINQAARFVGPAGAKECNWSNSTGVLNFQDEAKATFGTSNDLEIYHDGSHSIIKDSGTGNLRVITNNLRVENAAGTENQALFTENGSVELYYDNSKKFESTSLGGKVTGGLVVEAGSTNHTGDASLYVSKTTSSDWAGIFDCLSGSEYGLKVNCANGTDYAIAVRDTTNSNHPFRVEGSGVMHSRDHLPFQDNGYDLGTSSYRWRNIYTMDLQLSNEGGDGNSVDGTTGSWTIQEGADDLFIVNNKNGKKF